MYQLARPLLFRLDPERAHRCTLAAIRILGNLGSPDSRPAAVELLNLRFPKRWMEYGGLASASPRSARLRRRRPSAGVLGVSIGKNADTPLTRAVDDYVACLRGVHELADYIAVNISSPNTESLRELHEPDKLGPLLGALVDVRESGRLISGKSPPMLLKISPDLDVATLEWVARTVSNAGFDGVIATNSTVQRPPDISEGAPDGGLGGAPLLPLSIGAVTSLRISWALRFRSWGWVTSTHRRPHLRCTTPERT